MRISRFLKPLKSFKDIEYGNITFNLGVWKSIGVLIIFELFGDSLISIPGVIEKQTPWLIVLRIVLSLALLILVSWICVESWGIKSDNISNHSIPKKKIFIYFSLFLIGYILFFDATIGHILELIPKSSVFDYINEKLEKDMVFMVFDLILLAPIKEEFLMRGMICNGLSKRYSNKVAILVSAFMFALIHGNIHQGVNAFLLGIILGYAYLKTKSLYLTIFLHMLNNTLAFPTSIQDSLTGTAKIIYFIISIIIGSALLYKYYKRLKLSLNSKDVIEGGQNLQV